MSNMSRHDFAIISDLVEEALCASRDFVETPGEIRSHNIRVDVWKRFIDHVISEHDAPILTYVDPEEMKINND